jgi:hypothetical protein
MKICSMLMWMEVVVGLNPPHNLLVVVVGLDPPHSIPSRVRLMTMLMRVMMMTILYC